LGHDRTLCGRAIDVRFALKDRCSRDQAVSSALCHNPTSRSDFSALREVRVFAAVSVVVTVRISFDMVTLLTCTGWLRPRPRHETPLDYEKVSKRQYAGQVLTPI
jgi:hypothetical protein